LGEMSVTDTIFCRWELDVADNDYIRNENIIGAQTFKCTFFPFVLLVIVLVI
jgi:hypothetical protein